MTKCTHNWESICENRNSKLSDLPNFERQNNIDSTPQEDNEILGWLEKTFPNSAIVRAGRQANKIV